MGQEASLTEIKVTQQLEAGPKVKQVNFSGAEPDRTEAASNGGQPSSKEGILPAPETKGENPLQL